MNRLFFIRRKRIANNMAIRESYCAYCDARWSGDPDIGTHLKTCHGRHHALYVERLEALERKMATIEKYIKLTEEDGQHTDGNTDKAGVSRH
jgi:hypothetical protein